MDTILVRHKWEPYLWLLPSMLLMLIFVVFPIAIVFRISFSEVSRAGVVGGFVFRSGCVGRVDRLDGGGFILEVDVGHFLLDSENGVLHLGQDLVDALEVRNHLPDALDF